MSQSKSQPQSETQGISANQKVQSMIWVQRLSLGNLLTFMPFDYFFVLLLFFVFFGYNL